MAIDPSIPSTIKLAVRPSMEKFQVEHGTFEVITRSKRYPCHLNRQIIVLLEGLGVAKDVFIAMQERQLSLIEDVDTDITKAMQFLGQSKHGVFIYLLEYLSITGNTNEPFVRNCLQLVKNVKTEEMRNKAKIPVSEGALLLGVLDETLSLDYGQVFIKLSDMDKPFVGTVCIAKNPCCHPGNLSSISRSYLI